MLDPLVNITQLKINFRNPKCKVYFYNVFSYSEADFY